MGQPVDSKPQGIMDATGLTNSSKITANTRVTTANGPVGIQTDVPVFTGTTVSGLWTLGATRCRINGIPAINHASIGIGIASATPPGTTGPIRVGLPDEKVKVL